jgi:predicted lipoprotein
MTRTCAILCCLLFCGCLIWFFPLFHVVRIERSEDVRPESAFDAAEFATTFWSKRLIPSLTQGTDAGTLFMAIQATPKMAREKFGRKVGVSRTRFLVLQGSGMIDTLDKRGVGVALQSETKGADIVLQTGFLFGNTVRDATGLLSASDFPDSRQFNEISTELNRIVETQVVPMLKVKSVVGRRIYFAGCAAIPEDGALDRPLTVIPLKVRVE